MKADLKDYSLHDCFSPALRCGFFLGAGPYQRHGLLVRRSEVQGYHDVSRTRGKVANVDIAGVRA